MAKEREEGAVREGKLVQRITFDSILFNNNVGMEGPTLTHLRNVRSSADTIARATLVSAFEWEERDIR